MPWRYALVDHVSVPISVIREFDDFRTCSFCAEAVDVSTHGEGLVLTVGHEGHSARQELYAHPECLGRALHTGIPFDREMFFD